MKYEILVPCITRLSGGVGPAVNGLYNAFEDKKKIEIITVKDKFFEEDVRDVFDVEVKGFDAFRFFYSPTMCNYLNKSNVELLHLHTLWLYPHLFINKWKRKTSEPIICTPHGMLDPYIIRNQGKIKRFIAKWGGFDKALHNVSVFHALCEKEMEDIREYGLKAPIAIIPNGVNLPTTQPKKRSDNKKHLLFLGRIHHKKGVVLLIDALIDLFTNKKSFCDNWIADIVGWGDDELSKKIILKVKQKGLSDKIVFQGSAFGEKKDFYFANSSAFILPSYGEGLPISVLEAWSWKKPVIMTDGCNIPEGFDCKSAIRIETDIESIKKGLIAFDALSEKEAQSIGDNGYQLVCDNFTWKSAALKMEELYKWVTKNGDKPDFVYTL